VDATFPFGGAIYKLKQFHTHTVSEHTVDGEHYDMEMHFVHTTDDYTAANKVLVVAVFFKVGAGQGSPNWLRQLSSAVASAGPEPTQVIPLDFTEIAESVMVGTLPQNAKFKGFKPNYNNFWGYQGSFTTPPCTEGVQWLVLTNPIYAEAAEIDPLKTLEGDNFRPVQPLYGRKITVRECGRQCD
jgi:carbonic anhydrase